ncbi:MAG: hypothetical protein ACREOD_03075 [Candidatus Dormibacteria bacterium]
MSNPDPEELATTWLRIRRRYEAEAGRHVAMERRLQLLDLTMDQFRVFSNFPLDGIEVPGPEANSDAMDGLVTKGLIERVVTGPDQERLCLTPLGEESRRSLDRLQEATLRAMFESLGPELSSRMLDVLDDLARPEDETHPTR